MKQLAQSSSVLERLIIDAFSKGNLFIGASADGFTLRYRQGGMIMRVADVVKATETEELQPAELALNAASFTALHAKLVQNSIAEQEAAPKAAPEHARPNLQVVT